MSSIIEDVTSLSERLSRGILWQWWRRKPHGHGWDLRSDQIPAAVAIAQTTPGNGFLQCIVTIPTCLSLESPANQLDSLAFRKANHTLSWIMVKPRLPKIGKNTHKGLVSKFFLSTLDYAAIPSSPTEFFLPLVQQLKSEWVKTCGDAEQHLSVMRSISFQSNGRNPNLIKIHLEDAQNWTSFHKILKEQLSVLRSLHSTYTTRSSVLAEDVNEWSAEQSGYFTHQIELLAEENEKAFSQLSSLSQELIQLEFNLTSIAEARFSTSTNRSMKRLSRITFIFLPLMFISSLFGVNVNILANNPPWRLYILFALGTTAISLSVWIMFKRNPTLEDTIEDKFAFMLRSDEERDLDDEVVESSRGQRKTRLRYVGDRMRRKFRPLFQSRLTRFEDEEEGLEYKEEKED
ncbi:hypothetical protein AJ79_00606 [Helicocarpus griseus UAMH5409]|uniref:Uncharacterized protein n=1 Tax=Helicocarpus griseus UAMH5409 TaxID=1447875 RepID=A0A2B7YCF0_9EURO|nr:hypothetical protein AJ79_00606 [Helicocarpus griseus UAMH5409]